MLHAVAQSRRDMGCVIRKCLGGLAGRPAAVSGGVRWETTKVSSFALQAIPAYIQWDSDNDFSRVVGADASGITSKGQYTNFLPSIDFRIEPMDNLVARVSLSKTLARPDYGNLFASISANAPNRPTFLGGIARVCTAAEELS